MLYRMFSIYCTYTFYQVRDISQSFSEILKGEKLVGVSEMSQTCLIRKAFKAFILPKKIKEDRAMLAEEFSSSNRNLL